MKKPVLTKRQIRLGYVVKKDSFGRYYIIKEDKKDDAKKTI